jgi:hypothetical protein
MDRTIKGIQKVESVIGRWDPNDLAFVERIELQNRQDNTTTLIMDSFFQRRGTNWPDLEKEIYRVTIIFNDVSNLRLKDFGGGLVQIMGFDVHFIGDRGWEGIHYEIEDYEDDRIAFNCCSVQIQSVKLVDDWA